MHRARLHDGRAVVLKVRRPGIEAKVEADLRLLAHLAQLVESEVPEARRYQPVRVVEEFRRSLMRELDLAPRRATSSASRATSGASLTS